MNISFVCRCSVFLLFAFCLIDCSENTRASNLAAQQEANPKLVAFDSSIATCHILVALCDNKYQGILLVPPAIGNGDDAQNNLYWGCSYGISSYFKKSKNWQLVCKQTKTGTMLERLVFKSKHRNFYLICDAYRGRNIKECTIDFLKSCSGDLKDTIQINKQIIGINGNASLLTYIGHNGLMDFKLDQQFFNKDGVKREAVILACKSKQYFSNYMKQSNVPPVLWTTDLMCLEAYTIHDLLQMYMAEKNNISAMRKIAAMAYSKYQKCSQKAAERLLVSAY